MPRRLSYTERALDDLDAVRRWLTQPGSGSAAHRTLSQIRADIRHLKQSPCRWPAGVHAGVRERLCAGGYRVFYRVNPDTSSDATAGDVRVLRVYGPGQDRTRFAGS